MARKHDPCRWALWSFVVAFPLGWAAEHYVYGGNYVLGTSGAYGGIIAGLIAAFAGFNESIARDGASSVKAVEPPADQPPESN